jgi:hypothetical protein
LASSSPSKFGDGKWHDVPTIAAEVGFPEDHVKDTLENMRQKRTYKHKAEQKEIGTVSKYRIFREEEKVGTDELEKKLMPMIAKLKAEGHKNMATMSPPAVLYWAGMIEKQIEKWAEGKDAETKGDFEKTGLHCGMRRSIAA